MQVAFHIGAHCTDDDRLLRSLLRSKGVLAKQGVIIPGPGRYRALIRETVASLDGQVASANTQEALLDAIIDEDSAKRLVFANENFVCNIPRIFEHNNFYGDAGAKIQGLCRLFPDAEIEIFLALRNPATLLPALAKRANDRAPEKLLGGTNPGGLFWSELVDRIRREAPQAALTIWANEDTPLIWSELMHDITGVPDDLKLNGEFDLLSDIMKDEGVKRLQAYLADLPQLSESQRHRVIGAFLDKYALDEELEDLADFPGWTPDYVNALTDLYEEDLDRLNERDDINFITI